MSTDKAIIPVVVEKTEKVKKPRKQKSTSVVVAAPEEVAAATTKGDTSVQKIKKQKKVKDPNRKPNPWSIFISQEYHKVKKDLPNLTDAEIMPELSKRFAPFRKQPSVKKQLIENK